MALLRENPLIGDLQGKIGDLVIVNHKPGVKIIRKRPVRKAPTTAGEKANQSKMSGAIAYAKAVWADQPELKGRYVAAAKLQNRRGFDLAKSDFLRPPSVGEVDLSGFTGQPGEAIRVRTKSVFGIKEMQVRIRDLADAIMEQGPAVAESGGWVYKASSRIAPGQTVVVEVVAIDYPGHTATKRVDHACGPRP